MAKAKLPAYNQRRFFYGADSADAFGLSASEFENFAGQYGRKLSYNGADYFDFSGDASIQRWLDFRRNLVSQARAGGLTGARLQAVLAQAMYQRTDFEGADAETFYNDRENHSYQALAEALDAAYQDQYNSPVNQVARDRAAGINDSLTGEIAGDTAAADAAPSETLPSPGLDPAQRQAMDLQAKQLGLEKLSFGFSMAGQVFSNTLNLLSSMVGIQDVLSGINQRDIQAEGQRIANRDALQKSFLDTFSKSVPMPKAGDKFDPSSVMEHFPRGNYSPEELAMLDEWTRGGLFFSSDGTPSAALQATYNKDVAGAASALADFAKSSSLTGGRQSFSEAFKHYWEQFASYDQHKMAVDSSLSDLMYSYQEYQNALQAYELIVAQNEARASGPQADAAIDQAEYSSEVFNGMTGFAQKMLENRFRTFQNNFYKYETDYQEFDNYVTSNVISRIKEGINNGGNFSVGDVWLNNSRLGVALDGYYNVRNQRNTLPLGEMMSAISRGLPNINVDRSFNRSLSSGRSVSNSSSTISK